MQCQIHAVQDAFENVFVITCKSADKIIHLMASDWPGAHSQRTPPQYNCIILCYSPVTRANIQII